MKRICIYVTYDKQNIVDEYIGYMLSELQKCVDYLAVVCNEENIEKGLEHLTSYADEIYYRENVGFDAGAWKDALCNYIGWDKIYEYDELVLVNDSFFGPFIPMREVFDKMEKQVSDFWGLIGCERMQQENGDIVPEHIQSFFICICSDLLHDTAFKEYWNKMQYYKSFSEVVNNHETVFTKHFNDLGFQYSILADASINNSKNIHNNFPQYMFLSDELVRKRNFPFLKKQQLAYNMLEKQTQENHRRVIDYIDKNTEYNVDLIWDNMIRTLDVNDLYRNMHLHYISPNNIAENKVKYDCVVVVFANYFNSCEYIYEYLHDIKNKVDIIIYAEDERITNYFEDRDVLCKRYIFNIETEMSNLSKYEYICVLHDEDMSSDIRPSMIGKSHFFSIWSNLLSNIDYVIDLFKTNKRLGFLAPPNPDFSTYFGELGNGWNGNYENCKEIIEKKGWICNCSQDKPPFAIASDFWIRGNLVQYSYGVNEEYLKYLWIYIAQSRGYYSGIIESTEYASINEVNNKYYLDMICSQLKSQFGSFSSLLDLRKVIFSNELKKFCIKYNNIYIYGTGYMAEKYSSMFSNIKGYIVSDDQANIGTFKGKKVIFLSELQIKEEDGIVICVDKKYQYQIILELEKKSIRNYICI